jgi:hypothetical protein
MYIDYVLYRYSMLGTLVGVFGMPKKHNHVFFSKVTLYMTKECILYYVYTGYHINV